MQGKYTDRYKHDAASYEVTCLNCGKVFDAKRDDATYCSARCRVHASRAPQRKANAIATLGVMANQIEQISEKYKYDEGVFEAMVKLQKAMGYAVSRFEK